MNESAISDIQIQNRLITCRPHPKPETELTEGTCGSLPSAASNDLKCVAVNTNDVTLKKLEKYY